MERSGSTPLIPSHSSWQTQRHALALRCQLQSPQSAPKQNHTPFHYCKNVATRALPPSAGNPPAHFAPPAPGKLLPRADTPPKPFPPAPPHPPAYSPATLAPWLPPAIAPSAAAISRESPESPLC